MTAKEAEALYQKYAAGACTPEEERLLEATYVRYLKSRPQSPDAASLAEASEDMWWEVRKHLPARRILGYKRWSVAAAAVLAIAFGTWLLVGDGWPVFGDRQLAATEILPGGHRATLTLADGRVVNLDEAQKGIVIGAEDITYQDGVSLGLSPAGGARDGQSDGRGRSEGIAMLALTTPKGGTYQINLPDGSKAWLNSASTLKYPSRFSGDSREVILEGEAYFEVQGIQGTRVSRVPFKVRTAGQEVVVLGTQFNISAYPNDPETKTTLVTGKVRLEANGASLQLVPGEQGTLTGNGLEKNEVNTDQYTSWRDGIFNFTGKDLRQVMHELERWYDIEVAYEGETRGMTFIGRMSRQNTLDETLEILRSSKVNYRLEGRKLIITN